LLFLVFWVKLPSPQSSEESLGKEFDFVLVFVHHVLDDVLEATGHSAGLPAGGAVTGKVGLEGAPVERPREGDVSRCEDGIEDRSREADGANAVPAANDGHLEEDGPNTRVSMAIAGDKLFFAGVRLVGSGLPWGQNPVAPVAAASLRGVEELVRVLFGIVPFLLPIPLALDMGEDFYANLLEAFVGFDAGDTDVSLRIVVNVFSLILPVGELEVCKSLLCEG
jgi:hypothetical protein